MRTGSDLRPRMTLRVDGALCRVLSADYHGGQGKMGGVMHVKVRDLHTGKERERRFRAEEAVEEVQPDRQSLQFLYSEDPVSTFMNPERARERGASREVLSCPKEGSVVSSCA